MEVDMREHWDRLNEFLEEADIRREVEKLSRDTLIDMLQWNDRNGVWRDQDNISEGYEPLTKDEAVEWVVKFTLESRHTSQKFDGKVAFGLVRDLDAGKGSVGELVAVYHHQWKEGKAVIEGWRGPGMASEEFARKRLEPVNCGNVLVDMGGFWDCLPVGIIII
jgi:Ni/Co efflux regulator RcnB